MNEPTKESRRNGAIVSTVAVYGGRIISAIVQAGALVLLAREVTPGILGIVSVLVAVVSLWGLFVECGLGSSAGRLFARGDYVKARAAAKYHSRLMISAAFLVLVAVFLLVEINVQNISWSYLLLAPWIYLERRNGLRISLAIAAQEAVQSSVSLAVSRVSALIIFYLLVNNTEVDDVGSYFIFLILSALFSTFMLPRVLKRSIALGRSPSAAETLREARPFWVATLSGQARTMDTVVLSAMAGVTAAGLYAFPARAVGPLRLISTSLGSIAMPTAARRDWNQIRLLERGMWVLTGFFIVATVILWSMAGDFLVLLLGSEYEDSANILSILMLGVALNIPGALWSSILQGTGSEKLIARVGVTLVPIYYLFIIVGIYFWEADGAAWGVTGTFLLQFLVMLFFRFGRGWPESK